MEYKKKTRYIVPKTSKKQVITQKLRLGNFVSQFLKNKKMPKIIIDDETYRTK